MKPSRSVRNAVIASIIIWAAFAIPSWVVKGVFFSTFFVGLLGLLTIVPASIKTLESRRWFFPVLAVWIGVLTPVCFYAFRWSGSLSDKCDHLFVPLGVFACVSVLGLWGVEAWKKRLRRTKALKRPSMQLASST